MAIQHVELSIRRGIPPVPGNAVNAEQPEDEINLLNLIGFSVGEDGWIPKRSQVSGGGQWQEGTDGDDILLNASLGRIVETLTLTASAATYLTRFAAESRLGLFAQYARNKHLEFSEIEPIYLKWRPQGVLNPQYSLIYSIDIAQSLDAFTRGNINKLTITITREKRWRGLLPGDNPKKWTLEKRGVTFDSTSANLGGGSGNNAQLVEKLSGLNKITWAGGHTSPGQSPNAQNYLDVPASVIPGDLPALAQLGCLITPATGLTTEDSVLIYRDTKPFSMLERGGTTRYRSLILNASNGGMGTDATTAADTGASTGTRVAVSFATNTLIERLQFVAGTTDYILGNLHRGQFSVWVRARLSAGATTVNLQLVLGALGFTFFTGQLTPLSDAGAGGTGNTTEWVMVYLGQITLPYFGKAYSSLDGLGFNLGATPSDLGLSIYAQRASGAGVLYINDVLLIPTDEPSMLLQSPAAVTLVNKHTVYDSTGYLPHGDLRDMALYGQFSGGVFGATPIAMQGATITLRPKVNNRIHFLTFLASNMHCSVSSGFDLRLNIVPCWNGIRDE